MKNVFIDGSNGTTGLSIVERLKNCTDIQVLHIEENYKDEKQKRKLLEKSELVVLCLPDEASLKSVILANEYNIKILDASTAHRTKDEWGYGLPEMSPCQRDTIAKSYKVSNPGCYPTGIILLLRPLIKNKVLSPAEAYNIFGISGYSGGGKILTKKYENKEYTGIFNYSLQQNHKHLLEIQKYSNLNTTPYFSPIVAQFSQGMLIQIPLTEKNLKKKCSLQELYLMYCEAYGKEKLITIHSPNEENLLTEGFLSPQQKKLNDGIEIMIFGNENRWGLFARYNNLGKGASGAAIQNINLMLDLPEYKGLLLPDSL